MNIVSRFKKWREREKERRRKSYAEIDEQNERERLYWVKVFSSPEFFKNHGGSRSNSRFWPFGDGGGMV